MKVIRYLLGLFVLPVAAFTSTLHHEAYFQQHLNYKIICALDTDNNAIKGQEHLTYYNNSPDTLTAIWFHLYLNKYRTGAPGNARKYKQDRAAIEILSIYENAAAQTDFAIDYTLMKVNLIAPVLPGDSVVFTIKFYSKLPPADGRYGYLGDHYDVGNWFPTPVVYDRAGWHLHQHLDNEFYQEWADFNVEIETPKGFVVGATGNLMNPEIALQDTAAAIKENYYNYSPDTATTVWKFEAKMVHDFAWTADPDYVLMQSAWNGITLNILAMQANAAGWKQVTDWGLDALRFFHENYGPYPYDQITVADTYIHAGGIEYPNIVFINSSISPDFALNRFKVIVIHELAHNWFYGLLANNQTEEEWLDEGFTSFAEIECLEALFGVENNYIPNRDDWYTRHFNYENNDRKDNALSYLWLAKAGLESDPIDLMPDYLGPDAYISQYSKMANVLFMLEYVMGDSLFRLGLKNYFKKWHFRHPGPDDFIAVMEETSGRDLDWFFEQWLKTTRQLDYAVDKVTGRWIQKEGQPAYEAEVKLRNIGDIFMPIDLDVTLKNGETRHFQIPIDQTFKSPLNRPVLPYWHFSKKEYTARFTVPDKITTVEIDASQRLMDVNRLNNRSGFLPPMEFVFMKPQHIYPPINRYLWEGWPLLFYNDIDKLKAGFKLKGGYLDEDYKFDLSAWYKTGTHNADYDFRFHHPVSWFGNQTKFGLRTYTLDGHQGNQVKIKKQIGRNRYRDPYYRVGVSLTNHLFFDPDYLLQPWESGTDNYLELEWSRILDRYWSQKTNLTLRYQNSLMGSDFNYSLVELTWSGHYLSVLNIFELQLGLRAGASEGKVPLQHLCSIAGGNGRAMFDNDWYRARGSLYYPWFRQGHLYLNQGAQVRGMALTSDPQNLYGKNGLMISADLILPNPLDYSSIYLLRDLIPSVFFDVGKVWNKDPTGYKSFRKSAGFSIGWDRFFILEHFIPIEKIQMDFPLWLSHVPDDENNIDFRWLLRFDFDITE